MPTRRTRSAPRPPAIGLALGLCAVLGSINGILISVVGLQPFITTLVMMLAGRGLAKVITGGQNTSAVNERYRWIANGYVLGLPVVFLSVRGDRRGGGVRDPSIGARHDDRVDRDQRRSQPARRPEPPCPADHRVHRSSAFLAGIAGIFSTGTVMTVDVSQTGYQFELDAILAVVIGGTSLAGGRFSLAGAAIGALLIATLDKTVVFLGIPASATPAFKAAVIIVLYVAQSRRFRGWMAGLRPRDRRSVADPVDESPERWWRRDDHRDPRVGRPRRAEHRRPTPGSSGACTVGHQPSINRYLARHRDATSTGAALADLHRHGDLRAGHLRRDPPAEHDLEPADQQLPSRDPGGRHDVRDPHRWDRPVGRCGDRVQQRRRDDARPSGMEPVPGGADHGADRLGRSGSCRAASSSSSTCSPSSPPCR